MHLFYAPDLSSENYILHEEESRHCIKVLRLKEKDFIHLIDGKGNFYEAIITRADAKKCTVNIITIKKEYGKKNFYLHVAAAPTKNTERFEWFLEKVTEVGIDEITPLACKHSERTVIKTERLNKVIIAAMKQSLKAYLPQLHELTPFHKLIAQPFKGRKFIAHCRDHQNPLLKNTYLKQQDVLVLIGPEGDFSQEEIDAAIKQGFEPISLGSSRLRTETAALIACHSINFMNE